MTGLLRMKQGPPLLFSGWNFNKNNALEQSQRDLSWKYGKRWLRFWGVLAVISFKIP